MINRLINRSKMIEMISFSLKKSVKISDLRHENEIQNRVGEQKEKKVRSG